MFEAMERGELTRALRASARTRRSPRPTQHARASCSSGLDFLVVQDIFLTKTAELADVVLPARRRWCETEGTVTNSERRVQRVRKALDAARRGARRHRGSSPSSRAGSATTGATRRPRQIWNELPLAVADARRHELRAAGGAAAASSGRAPTRSTRARRSCTAACGRSRSRGPRAPFSRRRARPAGRGARRRVPAAAHDRPAPRLVQHRRADRRLPSPLRRGETLDLSPEDAERLRRREGEIVRVELAARLGRGAGAHRRGAAARAWPS